VMGDWQSFFTSQLCNSAWQKWQKLDFWRFYHTSFSATHTHTHTHTNTPTHPHPHPHRHRHRRTQTKTPTHPPTHPPTHTHTGFGFRTQTALGEIFTQGEAQGIGDFGEVCAEVKYGISILSTQIRSRKVGMVSKSW
jgi:hypothetical protein